MLKKLIFQKIINAIEKAVSSGNLGQMSDTSTVNIVVEKTKNPEFGDYAVNVSPLARYAKLSPDRIAGAIIASIELEDAKIDNSGGFINFKLGKSWLNKSIKLINDKKEDFGKFEPETPEKILLEYVSANPTGPLHIGHGRWAVVGSCLANLLKFAGNKVSEEFYINDAGNQINNLSRSLWLRVLQEMGKDVKFPQTEEEGVKNYYPGEYLIDMARQYLANNKVTAEKLFEKYPDAFAPGEEIMKEMADFAKAIILEQQKQLLNRFRVHFNTWYSELSLHDKGEVEKAVETLKIKDQIYEQERALWFKSSEYGDDQDRVIIKSDGSYTYLTADIAYHYDKLKRRFDRLINIWGADHHGYVARMKAAIAALGYDSNKLEVLLGQLVNLIIGGEQVRMGKRRKMLTLEELVDEVGIDATRFWMIMRSIDTTLDFDVDLAKSCSDENPVYYVQYAHARACSILRNSTRDRIDQESGSTLPPFLVQGEFDSLYKTENFDISILDSLWNTDDKKELESTRALVLKLESFEELIISSVKNRAPYMIARYLQELASTFHQFYTFTRVLNVEESIMKARLGLVYSTRQVLFNGLNLLSVSAPKSM